METLVRNGWKDIGQGVDKKVFGHPRYPRVVIKVFWSRFGWRHDPEMQNKIPAHFKPYWLPYTFSCPRFVVQPRLDRKPNKDVDWSRLREELDPHHEFDTHWKNVGTYRGKPVIIDLWTS